MIVGIVFILVGIYIFVRELLDMEEIDNERVVFVKRNIVRDRNFRFRIILGVFALVLGLFRILNLIIY